ncbi:N-acetylglutamate synthase [Alkalispirillum mobile]|uniref:Amino-acid acetyltransferase n=1 Tax=Alkalispirillum mobile TaxID=85925 RepID=A0A498C586_9GAMM|nr:amino-acid N-acetyltransferase [Alkalispirillum mobile]RLK51384.1 N-acetylglutamate synthase [Alkalispirillum mobile]
MKTSDLDPELYVRWFRNSAPYINAHRGRTFVVAFSGAALQDGDFPDIIHDLALLSSLGVRLVLVPGARPQVEARLRERGAELRYVNGLRITDDAALACVKEAVGAVRLEIEALFTMGLSNSPMAGARLRLASGNLVTARPLGVRDGVDYQHTGEVRRVDAPAIRARLDDGDIVLLSPLGCSRTGEVFNLAGDEVALEAARALRADKLIFLQEGESVCDEQGEPVGEMTLSQVRALLNAPPSCLTDETRRLLTRALRACGSGVHRVHLLDRHRDGALLLELFTRDGVGTLVTPERFETQRRATPEDVPGIVALLEPLERDGTLVSRPRELLETDIEHFIVIERDGSIIACSALYPIPGSTTGELAGFAVHPDYRGGGRGDALLAQVEADARTEGLDRLYVLTTRTAHWFQERGFEPATPADLPDARRRAYDQDRASRVFVKALSG